MLAAGLYGCARKNNCNKLVLAQHLDDCAESFLMSTMHNGFIRTMKAAYEINAGGISVIRPLVYCRESLMTEFVSEYMFGLCLLISLVALVNLICIAPLRLLSRPNLPTYQSLTKIALPALRSQKSELALRSFFRGKRHCTQIFMIISEGP